MKASNKEVFAGATTRKDLSLNQMMFWDAIEGTRGLFVEEQNFRKQAKEEY